MSGNALKWIAIVTMLIDHTACVLVSDTWLLHTVMRIIGRFAFPIFCFLIAEGVFYTKNRKNYLMRMALFALLSEIPFDLAFSAGPAHWLDDQNVFFTLTLGILGLVLYERFSARLQYGALLFPVLCMAAAWLLRTDYGALGVLMITLAYLLRRNKALRLGGMAATNLALTLKFGWSIQFFGCAALVPLGFYNGQRGRVTRFGQYFFYAFYPLHLLLLCAVRVLLV